MILIVILLAVIVIIFALAGLKVVPQSETRVIERLGKFHKVLPPGLNIIWPIIDRPKLITTRSVVESRMGRPVVQMNETSKIDLREQVYDFPKQNVITKDNVTTEINALLYFQIVDPVKSVYEIDNLPNAIEKLTQTTLRNVIGELELDETLTSRDTINGKLRTVLDDATNKWGVKVNRVELQDITPPESVRQAMEKQMQAERNRRAEILKAEGEKASAILNSEGEKISAINNAEAEKQSQLLIAEGIKSQNHPSRGRGSGHHTRVRGYQVNTYRPSHLPPRHKIYRDIEGDDKRTKQQDNIYPLRSHKHARLYRWY